MGVVGPLSALSWCPVKGPSGRSNWLLLSWALVWFSTNFLSVLCGVFITIFSCPVQLIGGVCLVLSKLRTALV